MNDSKSEPFHWRLTNLNNDLPEFTTAFRTFCEDCALNESAIFELELSLEELIVNSFTHGYGNPEGGAVTVDAERVENEFRVRVEDRAPPFDLTREAPPPRLGGKDPEPEKPEPEEPKEEKQGGLGIHLVKSLNDKVEYYGSNDGNRVIIIKSIKPEGG